mgnify:CR=1 FL=1
MSGSTKVIPTDHKGNPFYLPQTIKGAMEEIEQFVLPHPEDADLEIKHIHDMYVDGGFTQIAAAIRKRFDVDS